MLHTEVTVRDNIRNREGKRVFYLGKGDQLTSGARDYLRREGIEILPAEQARKERWELLDGGFVEEKPEHMTHLNGQVLVKKTHPRVVFRGEMDALEGEIMLCQLNAVEFRAQLGEMLALVRKLIQCDVLEKDMQQTTLCGLTEAQVRSHSHFPQAYYGQPHFMPEYTDGKVILLLNRCRCQARKAELAAVAAFADGDGKPTRVGILRALNRVSSMLYILMIRAKKEEKARQEAKW